MCETIQYLFGVAFDILNPKIAPLFLVQVLKNIFEVFVTKLKDRVLD